MLKKLLLFYLVLLSVFVHAQDLTATMQMPDVLAPGETYQIECTIVKGAINSYIKFSQKLPPNFKATELESKGGNFTFDDSIVRIVWFFPPAGSEFTFSYKIQVPDDIAGEKKIGGKIYYFYNTNREVFSFERKAVYIGTSKPEMVTTKAVKVDENTAAGEPTVNELNAALKSNQAQSKTDTVVIYKYVTDSSMAASLSKKQIQADTNVVKPISAVVSVNKDTAALSSIPTTTSAITTEAILEKKDTLTTVVATTPVVSESKPIVPTPSDSTKQLNVSEVKPVVPVSEVPVEKPVVAASVPVSSDVVYSVQLGTFKYEVPLATADKFLSVAAKGIKNLKEENGYTTFVTGSFKTKEDALPLKEEMIKKGFADAYIIALPAKNQNVLPVVKNKTTVVSSKKNAADVAKSESENDSDAFDDIKKTDPVVPVKPVVSEKKSDIKNNLTNTPKPTNTNSVPAIIIAGKTYRVQIGAFKEEVPLATANKFLQLAPKGVKNFKDSRGYTLYTVGDFLNRENADKLKAELIEKGFQDAFIVTFENGEIVK